MDAIIRRRQRGQNTLEYIGLAIVAALVLVVVVAAINTAQLVPALQRAICQITQPAGSCDQPGQNPNDPTGGWRPGGPGSGGADPGANVQLPSGLTADMPFVQEMMQTERGRRLLQWLHDNNINIIVDDAEQGAWYSNGEIVLGKDYQNLSTLLHEASHATWDKTGQSADIHGDKDAYVNGSLDDEANAVWLEVIGDKELRATGASINVTYEEQQYDDAFKKAYDAALAAGKSKADASAAGDQAGKDAMRLLFTSGYYSPSTSKERITYTEYYARQWHQANCVPIPIKKGC